MELVKIGVVVNTHGLRGTFKVKSFTDFKDERYKTGNILYINFKGENIKVTVTKFRTQKGIELLDVEEFKHINEIEKFKGSELFISTEYVHDLEDDEFYFTELIGMDVYNDEFVGTCIDVMEVPQGEMLVIKREGTKNALVPFQKEFVEEVNKKENKIIIKDWEGLLWG